MQETKHVNDVKKSAAPPPPELYLQMQSSFLNKVLVVVNPLTPSFKIATKKISRKKTIS